MLLRQWYFQTIQVVCLPIAKLAERGLFLSHGDFYAMTVVERLGLSEEGLVRAGCACYTTEDEAQRLIDGVRDIARHWQVGDQAFR